MPYEPKSLEERRTQRLKEIEDKYIEWISQAPELALAIAYKTLFARGFRIATIDADIRRLLKEEIK